MNNNENIILQQWDEHAIQQCSISSELGTLPSGQVKIQEISAGVEGPATV
jgi:hypothetical protein